METRTKYPRTKHLPWSPGVGPDDLVSADLAAIAGQAVVVTEKMDGENTSLYRDGVHARSLETAMHPSRAWVRALQGQIGQDVPRGWRICGENMYAQHSLRYENLASYFLVFSIWTDKNECLSWDDTKEWCALLGLATVPVLSSGPFDEAALRALAVDTTRSEGYVVRLARSFAFADFPRAVAKWVRDDHVQTDEHWLQKPVVPNRLVGGGG